MKYLFTVLLTLALVAFVNSVPASNEAPNFVWWAECQTDGPVKICRQGGNQLNLSVRYEGFLLQGNRQAGKAPIQAHVKLNGQSGSYEFTADDYDSGQLFLSNKFLNCRTTREGIRKCQSAPDAMRELFLNASGDGDKAGEWNIEVYFTGADLTRRDDRSGSNFRFRFPERI